MTDTKTSDVDKSGGKIVETTFEEAFDLTGHGRFNHLVQLTSGLIMLNVTMESVGMGYVIPVAECELNLSSEQKGLVSAAAFIGIVTTSFLWGYLSDMLGRRAVMLPAMLAAAAVSIISSFSTNVWMLFVLRVFTGCLISASSATVYAYLGEMHTFKRRAASMAWGSLFISFAFMILPGMAWLIIPGKWSFTIGSIRMVPWRAFMWSWCVPGLVAAVILMMLPESPRFIFSSQGPEKALPVLAKMYQWNHPKTSQKFPVDKIMPGTVVTSGFAAALKNSSLLFRSPLLRCVIISHICIFMVFMLSSGLYMWVPDILNNIIQTKSPDSATICTIIPEKFGNPITTTLDDNDDCKTEVSVVVFPILMVMGVVIALTYLAIGLLVNKLGKKRLYCSIVFVCGMATAAVVFVPDKAITTVMIILLLCCGCAASILAALCVNIFPTCLRAMAMCIMYMVGRTGAAVGSYVLGATLESHCEATLCTFGMLTSGSTLLMLLWPKPAMVKAQMEQKGLSY